MEVTVESGNVAEWAGEAVVVNLFEGVTAPGGATGAVDRALDGAISQLIADGEIRGKSGEMTVVHTLGKMPPKRVLVAGLGERSDFDLDAVRSATAESCRSLRRIGVRRVATIAHGAGIGGLDAASVGQALAEGALLGLYRFDRFKSSSDDRRDVDGVTIVELDADKREALEKGVARGAVIAKAVNLCRDMANEPPNSMTPTRMAEAALEVANESGLEMEVLDRPQMVELSMGALLGVAQGSDEPPKLIVLRYRGDPDDESGSLGLLGKGITFDSGGLDIKSASGMATMKGDMAGGAAVIAAIGALGQLKPKINVTAIVAATENMPGGGAQRPGDVVRTMNGKTIEITNTDAEGRLVLADAMAYARKLGLSRLVDVATLTGAVVVALGNSYTGVFGNDQGLVDQVVAAGRRQGELMWQLPLHDGYREGYKSDVADIQNTGGRGAGSIVGAQIIGEFADGASWVHLDIAGVSRTTSGRGYSPKGATGTPVRTLVALAEELAANSG